MKVYVINEDDVARLKAFVNRDPQHGYNGGSSDSTVNDPGRREAYDEAHRFYNYQVHRWLSEVTK